MSFVFHSTAARIHEKVSNKSPAPAPMAERLPSMWIAFHWKSCPTDHFFCGFRSKPPIGHGGRQPRTPSDGDLRPA
jgi:hypothetical protein